MLLFQSLYPDSKIKILTSVLILEETDLRSCAQCLVLEWLFSQYLINSGFMRVPVLMRAEYLAFSSQMA